MNNFYIKMSPLAGMVGYGGGGTGLTLNASSPPVHYGDRGLVGGGNTHDLGGRTIQYISIANTGNATDFGDLTDARHYLGSCANGSLGRATWGGGKDPGRSNLIDYVTISSTGDATDFGDLSNQRERLAGACDAANDRGYYGGGDTGGALSDRIDYIVLSTTGNATDTGNLSYATKNLGAAASSAVNKIYWFNGIAQVSNNNADVDYIQVILDSSTGGNSYDYGNSTQARGEVSATSNDSRCIIFGGYDNGNSSYLNTIDYLTIDAQVGGNCTDFGDLGTARRYTASMADATRAVCAGGHDGTSDGGINEISYVTIQTTGNSTDFGDLIDGRRNAGGCSGD